MREGTGPRRYEVLVGSAALEDLRLIRDYIANQLSEPEAARRTVGRVLDAIDSLATMPERNRVVGVTADGTRIRQARSGNYAILYFVSDHAVRVASVAYGSRDLSGVISKISLRGVNPS